MDLAWAQALWPPADCTCEHLELVTDRGACCSKRVVAPTAAIRFVLNDVTSSLSQQERQKLMHVSLACTSS